MCLGDSRGSGSVGLIHDLHSAKMNSLPRLQRSFFDRRAIDESAVGRAEVADKRCVVFDKNLAMRAGNGGMVDLEIVCSAAF